MPIKGCGTDEKREPLNSSLDFSGAEALCTDMKFAGLSAAYVNAYILDIDQPTAPRVAVRVTYGIPCSRAAAAAITEL